MPKKRHIITVPTEGQPIEESIVDTINKSFGGDTLAYTLGGLSAPPSLVTDWIPTGLDLLDIAISNKRQGGYPMGRVVEVMGLEATGKSLLVAHALKETQRMGGIAVLLDTESAADLRFLKAIGVDVSTLIYAQPECIEDCFQMIETIIERIRSSNENIKVTIALDSVMASPTKAEIFGEVGVTGYDTEKARLISKAMRKIPNLLSKQNITLIFTNQLRMDLNSSVGEKYKTSGGMAIAFHSSVRIQLKKVGEIVKSSEVVGVNIEATIIKNKVAIPLRKVRFPIMFSSGVDNMSSLISFLVFKGILTKTKDGLSYVDLDKETGEIKEEINLGRNLEHYFSEHPDLWERLKEEMYENLIISYENEK